MPLISNQKFVGATYNKGKILFTKVITQSNNHYNIEIHQLGDSIEILALNVETNAKITRKFGS